MTDTKKLRERINHKGLKLGYLAKQLGLSAYGLALKINNVHEFTSSEIVSLCELLDISSLKEKESIFFKKKDD